MKKKAIVLLAFAATLTAVSCQKENITGQNESSPLTVSAVSEGLGSPAKTELAFKYDVLWSNNDKIYIKDASANHDTFTLQNGAGTTKGTFKQDGEVKFTGEVQAYYPATMLESGSPVWPAFQTNDQTIPMYSKKTLSGATEERMDFNSLGSVLQLNFNSTTADIVLKSVEVKADEAMSGAFTIENGQAKVCQPEGYKPGIILDLGEGVTLGTSAKKFNKAVPAGEYHGLSIIFTATDGKECTINAKKDKTIGIVFNTVNTLAVSGEFKTVRPAGALKGVFTVKDLDGTPNSGDEKKVHFSKGNLWADGSNVLHFEDAQWKFTPSSSGSKDASHVSHFTWSNNVADAVGDSYSGKNLFCDEDNKVSVDGGDATYYALSTAEWQYLFNYGDYKSKIRENKYKWATVNGVGGYVIAPDDFTGTLSNNYANDAELVIAGNLVFLPAAGNRMGPDVVNVGNVGNYWSSSANGEYYASYVLFDSSNVFPDYKVFPFYGFSVRLITESK